MRALARGEGGQAIVLVALGMTAVLAGAGLAVDAGLEQVERRREQVAADAAAFAAASSLTLNWNASNRATLARTAALEYAASNGYDNNGTTNTVTVNIPPTSGAYSGNADFAEVKISVNVPTAFIRILGSGFQTRTITGRAVGGITGPAKPYALIALSKTASPGFSLTGNAEVEVEKAGILVNSNASTAASCSGSQGEVEAEDGGIDVAGGVSWSNCEIEGTVTTGVAQQTDPLAYLVRPDGVGLTTFAAVNVTSGTTTIAPGIYPSISASGSGKVKLQPGTYVIKGGGISASGNGRIEDETQGNGQGVFVFNACTGFPLASGSCGGISVSGNGRIELEKETSGTYAGLSIWQPCENTQTLSVSGSGSPNDEGSDDEDGELETSGTIYLPCAAVQVTGNGEVEIEDGQLVASTVTVTGNGEIEVEWDSAVSTVSRIPSLVE